METDTQILRRAGALPGKAQRGSVLVAVLAIILLLSFMVTRFMNEAVEDLEYRAIFNEPADVRSFAYSMLEVTLATIQEVALIDDGKLYASEQGWGNPIEYAGIEVPDGWSVDIDIQDESGELPLNTMSEALLNRILEEALDFDFGTTRELSSTLRDWIDTNDNRRLNGAESEEYLARNPPYRAANGPLQSLEELRLIKVWDEEFFDENGQPNEYFQQLADMVSVIHSGPANLNSAPQSVLDVLSLENGWQADYIFDGMEEPYLKSLPDSADGSTAGVEITLLRVTVRLMRGNVPFMISALVEPDFTSNGQSGSTAGSASGRNSGDAPKTGSTEEQEAIRFPFKLLRVSEYHQDNKAPPSARHSAVDIVEESTSF